MDAMGKLIFVLMIGLALVFAVSALGHQHKGIPCFIIFPLGLAGIFFARGGPRRRRAYRAARVPTWATTCPSCGRSVAGRPGASFCPVCGASLQG